MLALLNGKLIPPADVFDMAITYLRVAWVFTGVLMGVLYAVHWREVRRDGTV